MRSCPFDPAIFKRFRQLCSCARLLPLSYIIPGSLITREDFPVNSGRFGDVWRGVYDEQLVAIKGLRIYREDDVREIKRVGWDDSRFQCSLTSFIRYFTRRLLCGHGYRIPTLSRSWEFAMLLLRSLWYQAGCRTAMYDNMSEIAHKRIGCSSYVYQFLFGFRRLFLHYVSSSISATDYSSYIPTMLSTVISKE